MATEMSMRPSARLAAYSRPFSYVGIDYFGPILVTVARHKEKRWGVIFTCLTIRAVHLEVSRDLSTDSFILQLQNFIARRGNPISIHCDNGTNFRGAEIELRKAVQEIDFKKLEQKFSSASTSWHFNPPAAPHMGGSWERLIRSIKNILYKISPNYSFRDDTLQSALIECERIINSRPLTYVELESSEEALTPNHFLLGSSNGHKPLGSFENDCDHRRHWRRIQHFADLFWKRWVNEYLPTLTKRTRWFTKERDLVVDDIVIIVDPTMARNSWPQGRIISVNRGKDNVVRSGTVKTQDGIFIRPATKLARLDVRN